jgi:hypothetical protein
VGALDMNRNREIEALMQSLDMSELQAIQHVRQRDTLRRRGYDRRASNMIK